MAPHPNVRIPDPGGYEFYSFGLLIQNMYLVCLLKYPVVLKKILKNFYLFYAQ